MPFFHMFMLTDSNLPDYFCHRGISDCLYSLTHNENIIGSFIGLLASVIAAAILLFQINQTEKLHKEQIRNTNNILIQQRKTKLIALKAMIPIHSGVINEYICEIGKDLFDIYEYVFIKELDLSKIDVEAKKFSIPHTSVEFLSQMLEFFDIENSEDKVVSEIIIVALRSINNINFRYKLFQENRKNNRPVYAGFLFEHDLKECAKLHATLSILDQYGNGIVNLPGLPSKQETVSSLKIITSEFSSDEIIERIFN